MTSKKKSGLLAREWQHGGILDLYDTHGLDISYNLNVWALPLTVKRLYRSIVIEIGPIMISYRRRKLLWDDPNDRQEYRPAKDDSLTRITKSRYKKLEDLERVVYQTKHMAHSHKTLEEKGELLDLLLKDI